MLFVFPFCFLEEACTFTTFTCILTSTDKVRGSLARQLFSLKPKDREGNWIELVLYSDWIFHFP